MNNITLFKTDDLSILNIKINHTQSINFKEKLEFYSNKYKLCGSIWVNDYKPHAICGAIDGNNTFIYDSRNQVIYIDWIEALKKNIDLNIEGLRMCATIDPQEKIYYISNLLYINDK